MDQIPSFIPVINDGSENFSIVSFVNCSGALDKEYKKSEDQLNTRY